MNMRMWSSSSRIKAAVGGIALLALALMVLPAGRATAGQRDVGWYVYVSGGGNNGALPGSPAYAWGTMGGARNTADTVSRIGCSIEAHDNWGSPVNGTRVTCTATNASGLSLYCTTMNPVMAQAVAGIADDSYILFYADNNAKCVYVGVGSQSNFPVRIP